MTLTCNCAVLGCDHSPSHRPCQHCSVKSKGPRQHRTSHFISIWCQWHQMTPSLGLPNFGYTSSTTRIWPRGCRTDTWALGNRWDASHNWMVVRGVRLMMPRLTVRLWVIKHTGTKLQQLAERKDLNYQRREHRGGLPSLTGWLYIMAYILLHPIHRPLKTMATNGTHQIKICIVWIAKTVMWLILDSCYCERNKDTVS